VVSLSFLRPAKGQPFALDVLMAVIRRYSFQHFPEKVPILESGSITLSVGKWNDVQIDELGAYNDGFVVSARASSDVIDEFLDDLYEFVAKEFRVTKVPKPQEARHYESSVVVEMDRRITSKFDFLRGLYSDLADFRSSYGHGDSEYVFGAVEAHSENIVAGGRRPMAFKFERRLNAPFDANYWFSSAPLKTGDHIATLENLEAQLLRG